MSGRRHRTPRCPELSQHFLRSRTLATELVKSAEILASDTVVEFGAGEGILTEPIAQSGARVLAIEIDPALSQHLRRRFADRPRVQVIQGDILQVSLPGSRHKVLGNLPFGVTADAVRRLTRDKGQVTDATLIVQREAGERFTGHPRGPETRWSLCLKPWWHVEIIRSLRRTDFQPPPSVESVLLRLVRRTPPLVNDSQSRAYRRFVQHAFGSRGFTVRKGLRTYLTKRQILRLAADLRFDPLAPPSALTFDQWLGVFRFVEHQSR